MKELRIGLIVIIALLLIILLPGRGINRTRRFFKATNYPPVTAAEKEQWERYLKMRKADPEWEWQMPIEFYGKVIDQFGMPVPDATVELHWVNDKGNGDRTMQSDLNGLFAISNIHGKFLSASVTKKNYLNTKSWIQSFEYAEFFDAKFYTPDSNNPAIFALHKILNSEPFYFYSVLKVNRANKVTSFDLARGKTTENGDISVKLSLGDRTNNFGPDYSFVLEAQSGAVLFPTNEEVSSTAPESGYVSTISGEVLSTDPAYRLTTNIIFYARTRAGKYARVDMRIGDGQVEATIIYNPSGSRVLEYDPDKRINR